MTAVKKAKNGNTKASRPASTEYNDYASASESDVEEGKGHHYACHHCYSSGEFNFFWDIYDPLPQLNRAFKKVYSSFSQKNTLKHSFAVPFTFSLLLRYTKIFIV